MDAHLHTQDALTILTKDAGGRKSTKSHRPEASRSVVDPEPYHPPACGGCDTLPASGAGPGVGQLTHRLGLAREPWVNPIQSPNSAESLRARDATDLR